MFQAAIWRNFLRHVETDQYIPTDLAVLLPSRIGKKDSQNRLLGIVHRDVNPKNIMIAREGDVKLTDFGIAKALDLCNKEGEVIAGKDEYLSPEQARCEVTDHRADLFCCGIVMSELLLGYNLFETVQPEKTIENILEMPLPNFSDIRPDIDDRLISLCNVFQRPRDERYQSAEEMLTELESFIYGEGYGPTNESWQPILERAKTEKMQPYAGTEARPSLLQNKKYAYKQGLRQVQKQTQSLVLAPQLRQSLKILQVPTLELRSAILEELQTNPLKKLGQMMKVWIPQKSNFLMKSMSKSR